MRNGNTVPGLGNVLITAPPLILKENEAEVLAFKGHLKILEDALKDANEVIKDTEGRARRRLEGHYQIQAVEVALVSI